jgi:predicted RNA binding protein YcfA (HicA-like mRNA interferase family)
MSNKRSRRLRSRLEGVTDATVADIEAYLRAIGWTRRRAKGSHRAWIKEGRRTLVIPVHGTRVRQYIIRQVLEATDEEAGGGSGD